MKGKQIIVSSKPRLIAIGLVELGLMIKHKRTSNYLKIKDAADLLGMSVTTLIKIEKGSKSVTNENLFKALDGFGVELNITDS